MERYPNMTSLVITVVLAAGAMAATNAQANPGTVTLDGGLTQEAEFHAEQTAPGHTWALPNKRVWSCGLATFQGVVASGAMAITAQPTYETCHVSLTPNTWPATILLNGCDFSSTLGTELAADSWSASAHLDCPGTDLVIEVYVPGTSPVEHGSPGKLLCRYTIPEQEMHGVRIADNTDGTLNISTNNVGLSISKVFGTLANCGGNGTLTYNGQTKVTGSTGGVPVNLGVH
jgi:hypothetical protein